MRLCYIAAADAIRRTGRTADTRPEPFGTCPGCEQPLNIRQPRTHEKPLLRSLFAVSFVTLRGLSGRVPRPRDFSPVPGGPAHSRPWHCRSTLTAGMLYRALDVIFQHLFRLIAVLLVVPLVAGGIGLALDHASTVEARIWADKPIFTPQFATDRFTSGDSPADIEAGILRELIGTSQFATEVLTAVDFSYPNWSTDQQNGAEADLQTNATVTTEGAHLFTLDYKTNNTARGRQVINAILAAFGRQVQALDTTQV